MLKPDLKDPNYKEQMEAYKQDPSSWGPRNLMIDREVVSEDIPILEKIYKKQKGK